MLSFCQLKIFLLQILVVTISALVLYIIFSVWRFCEEYNGRRREKVISARALEEDIKRLRGGGKNPKPKEDNIETFQRNEDEASFIDSIISRLPLLLGERIEDHKYKLVKLSSSQLGGTSDFSFEENEDENSPSKTFKINTIQNLSSEATTTFSLPAGEDKITLNKNTKNFGKIPEDAASNMSEKKIKVHQYDSPAYQNKNIRSISNYKVIGETKAEETNNEIDILLDKRSSKVHLKDMDQKHKSLKRKDVEKRAKVSTRGRAGEAKDDDHSDETEDFKDAEDDKDHPTTSKNETSTTENHSKKPEVIVDKLHTLIIVDENGAFVECFQFRESDYYKALQNISFADKFKKEKE